MRTVSNILQEKSSEIYTVQADTAAFKALQMMVEKNIGALIVLQESRPVGLITERDYARKIAHEGNLPGEAVVADVMTRQTERVTPQEDLEECMELMTYHRVRYLPVFDGDDLIGLISLGDIVKSIIEHKQEVIDQLENYIKGRRS